jgi:hypothetical protein
MAMGLDRTRWPVVRKQGMQNVAQEKRSKPRVALATDAIVILGKDRFGCKALNVSSTGMALTGLGRGIVGSLIQVQFSLPSHQGWLPAEAMLMRLLQQEKSYIWGVRFQNPASWVLGKIEIYVRQHLAALASEKRAAGSKPGGNAGKAFMADPATRSLSAKNRELSDLYKAALKGTK